MINGFLATLNAKNKAMEGTDTVDSLTVHSHKGDVLAVFVRGEDNQWSLSQ